MKKNKKIIIAIILVIVICSLPFMLIIKTKETSLPKPEITTGLRGEFGIDKNINETTIDKYLNRSDSVYRDMRMLKDPGNYESIGGDSYLSGYVEGFEIVPYPYIVNVTGLPETVGDTYKGKTLFTLDEVGKYQANYKESKEILEDLFPKDKKIFLMCGGGGYAGMMKNLLISLGWNQDNIYAFWKVPYHDIDFDSLNEAN